MKTIKWLSFQLIHLHKKTNNYDRGLISDMSEAVRIVTRPQFELNFDNRHYSVLSLHGIQSVWVFESTVGEITDFLILR